MVSGPSSERRSSTPPALSPVPSAARGRDPLHGRPVSSQAHGHRCQVDRHALLEQALVNAEIVRAQAELNCAESLAVYDAASDALRSSQQALAAATRTTTVLRELVSRTRPRPDLPDRAPAGSSSSRAGPRGHASTSRPGPRASPPPQRWRTSSSRSGRSPGDTSGHGRSCRGGGRPFVVALRQRPAAAVGSTTEA
jgi:hypothetical protein